MLITIRGLRLGRVVRLSRLDLGVIRLSRLIIIRPSLRRLSLILRLSRLGLSVRLSRLRPRLRSRSLRLRGLRSRGRNTGALRRGRRTAIISLDRLADVRLLALGRLRVEPARLARLSEAVAVVLPDADVVGPRALKAVGVVGEEAVIVADVGVLAGLNDGLACGGC